VQPESVDPKKLQQRMSQDKEGEYLPTVLGPSGPAIFMVFWLLRGGDYSYLASMKLQTLSK